MIKFNRSGPSGNIFAILANASRLLHLIGDDSSACEMKNLVFASHSYEEALAIIGRYVCLCETEEYI